MRRTARGFKLNQEQAAHALRSLIDQGKIKAQDALNALRHREKLIRELKERMAQLGVEGFRLTTRMARGASRKIRAARKASGPGRKASPPVRKRAKPRISAATRKIYQAQGRYMAALRQLSKADRTKIKATREKSGLASAMVEAKSLSKARG